MAFGDRYADGNARYRYSSSLALGVGGDWPLTRRSGLLLDVTVAPLADQSQEIGSERFLGTRAFAWRTTLNLGWRFKPAAPVYFAAGGGVFGATKPAEPNTSGSVMEPEGTFTVGYDGKRLGNWNVRGAYVGHLVKASVPDGSASTATAESISYDWVLQVGLRYSPSVATAGSPR